MQILSEVLYRDENARVEDGVIVDFGDPPGEFASAKKSEGKCPLFSLGVVAFSGDDALSFINAQFTTNCLELTADEGQLSAWCDPKGRVLFLFVLFTDGNRYYAVLPADQTARYIQRLRMYVLRAAVEISDETAAHQVIGRFGDAVETRSLLAPWSTQHTAAGTTLIRFGPGPARYLHIVPAADAVESWHGMDTPAVGERCWNALNTMSGIPVLDDISSGQYLPQQLNLDQINAVSFSKGCYPGQEIVARLKYRGEVKKRLVAAAVTSACPIEREATLHASGAERTAGRITCSSAIGADEYIVSAVADVGTDWGQVRIEGNADARLRRLDLPYVID